MTPGDLPPWLCLERGSAPILVVAPHGGRRHERRHPGKHKVNDLRTADLTRELATALGATAIINERLDRNHLDLNRLSQVRRDAPWLLTLVADVLAEMVADGGQATVLIVHGWNVSQSVCDVGVGLRESPDGLVAVRSGTATVSDRFVAARLRPLQRAAASAGIAVTIGTRYPAAHPNNLLQAFRGLAESDEQSPNPIAAICRRACVEAVQLELGIPLRWPGPRRQRLLSLLADAFGGSPRADRMALHDDEARRTLRTSGGRLTQRRGIQFIAGELLVMTSIDAGDDGALGGRLLVSTDAGGLALFTGEVADPAERWCIPPLAYRELAEGGLRVTYDGPMVRFPTLLPFLDLERGLADGELGEAFVDVTFRPDCDDDEGADDARFGWAEGEVTIGGEPRRIAARAMASAADPLRSSSLPGLRVVLMTAPWGPLALRDDPREALAQSGATRLTGALLGRPRTEDGRSTIRALATVVIGADRGTLELDATETLGPAFRMIAVLDRLVPVRRPGRDQTVIETTYAVIRVDGHPIGWVEVTVSAEITEA